ncbi:tetratricopeptide (TPR) repeat protein [Acidovorax soli]|uniref:Tetratricopeptide (TPR) repeat protein n=1 Tax=Acidovorax soli TaxID=592050 RepID=A0A7X0PDS9_9BURK|nr:VIT domain-containing protein [Acidovorax soli]MBB6560060.1 tetratricopeptide (TPR) repeat protein [Acidovorax soli]
MTMTFAPAPLRPYRTWQRRLLGGLCALVLLPLAAPTQAQRTAPPPQVHVQPQSPVQPPRFLAWQAPEARTPIELRRMDVQATIVGRTAATRIELELFNPNARVLEAQLQFPLAEGQSVTGFALDIEGELRPAVPVEKAKGRQVFEDVTRARVDPALLESVGGNHHRLRVYPLPANGSRRVVLELAEVLPNAAAPVWRLPMGLQAPAARLDVSVRVAGVAPGGIKAQLGTLRLPAHAEGADARITLASARHSRGDELRVQLPTAPQAARPLVATQRFDGASYFYAELPVAARSAERARPERVGLVWDASGSGAARDHTRELALLDAWLRRLGTVEVLLQPVRDVAGPIERYSVQGGNWSALRDRLKAMAYDGATQAAALRAPEGVQMALVFSDGLGNWGAGNDATALPAQPVPTYALSASAGSNAAALRRMAEASGGNYLDLLAVSTTQALDALARQAPRVQVTAAEGADDVELASTLPEQGRIALAGRFTGPEAVVTLQWPLPGGKSETRSLRIQAPAADDAPANLATGVAAHRWAALRMARLEAEGERQRAAVRRLGQAFRIASRETSLIVLDTVQDYARHGIEPPPALRARWAQLRTDSASREAARSAEQLDRIARQFGDKIAWWEQDFPKGDLPAKPKEAAGEGVRAAAAPTAQSAALPPPAAAPMAQSAPAPMAQSAPVASGQPALRMATAAPGGPAAPPSASIQLRAWQPDAPYLRRLRAAGSVEDMEAIYLDERPSHTHSTAFFLDVADLLYERGHSALARRVLSNLAEMELENRHVLRILAYRLLQAGDTAVALPVLRSVLALAPDEPQSWRDLGLALAKAGQHQAAVDQLWQVVAKPWDGRFPGVELIALAELNAIAAQAQAQAAGQPVNTAAMDPRLLRNLPLDLRAVLSWDADNTDIDLYVEDPNGQQAYYGHRLTTQGGRMSADFTGGYGPEEFSLKHAKPGTYTVRARFFGHNQQLVTPATTLMLRLSTGFGTPAQKDQDVVLRLTGRGDVVTVGSFTIGPRP